MRGILELRLTAVLSTVQASVIGFSVHHWKGSEVAQFACDEIGENIFALGDETGLRRTEILPFRLQVCGKALAGGHRNSQSTSGLKSFHETLR